MWLGSLFASRTGTDVAALQCIDNVTIERIGEITKLTSGRDCFTSAEGAEGAMQNTLRKALFPRVA
jgi:hypothetical protein